MLVTFRGPLNSLVKWKDLVSQTVGHAGGDIGLHQPRHRPVQVRHGTHHGGGSHPARQVLARRERDRHPAERPSLPLGGLHHVPGRREHRRLTGRRGVTRSLSWRPFRAMAAARGGHSGRDAITRRER